MKKLLLALFVFSSICANAQKQFLQEIVYDVPLKYLNYETAVKHPSSGMQGSELYKFITPLLTKIKRGEIKCYSNEYPFDDVLLTSAQAIELMVQRTTMTDNDDSKPNFVADTMIEVVDTISYSQIGGVRFHEDWYFNPADLSIEKKVKGILLLQEIYNNSTGEYIGYKPLLYIKLNVADATTEVQNNLLKNDFDYPVYIKNPNDYDRETDWWFQNLEPSKREKVTRAILNSIKNNTQPIYDAANQSTKLNSAQLINIITKTDTVEQYDESGMPFLATLKTELAYSEITKLIFNESWYFDINKLMMVKKVNSIIPMTDRRDPSTNELIGNAPLVYIPTSNSLNSNKTTAAFVNEISYMSNLKLDTSYAGKWANDAELKGIDTMGYYKMMQNFITGIEGGSLKCYDYFGYTMSNGKNKKMLSSTEIKNIMHRSDTVYIIDNLTGTEKKIINTTNITSRMCKGIGFIESWNFDAANYSFTKTVKGITPARENFGLSDGVYLGLRHIAMIDLNMVDEKTATKKEFLIAENISYLVNIKCQHDWRENYFNYNDWTLNCVELIERKTMLEVMLNDLISGKTAAYLPDGKHKTKLKPTDIVKLYNYEFLFGDNVLKEKLDYSKITAIEFTETWYYNPSTNSFYKKVTGITLLRDKAMNAPGEGEYVKLFYIPMN